MIKLPKLAERILFVIFFCALLGITTATIEYLSARNPLTPAQLLKISRTYQSQPFFNGHMIKKAYTDTITNVQPGGEILLAAYIFTCPDIARKLIQAHKQGTSVTVIVDKEYAHGEFSQVKNLKNAGIPVYISESLKMHNKFQVTQNPDGTMNVITGSFNPTTSASTSNEENIVLIFDPAIATAYREHFKKLLKNATPVQTTKS